MEKNRVRVRVSSEVGGGSSWGEESEEGRGLERAECQRGRGLEGLRQGVGTLGGKAWLGEDSESR